MCIQINSLNKISQINAPERHERGESRLYCLNE